MTVAPTAFEIADLLLKTARDHAAANPQGTSLAEFYEAQAATVLAFFAAREAETIQDRVRRYGDLVQAGKLTPNEARTLSGLRPIHDGDKLVAAEPDQTPIQSEALSGRHKGEDE